MQTKMEIDQRDLDAIERSVRENKERLIRNIVSPVEGFTVNNTWRFKTLICQNQTLYHLYNYHLMLMRWLTK